MGNKKLTQNKLIKTHIHKKVGKHVLKHSHKISHIAHKTHHCLLHTGELILVASIGFMSLMFAGSSNLPNNSSFTYPLQKVSKLECRTLYRGDMPDSCKINLPIIHGAYYDAYKNNELYRSIYTTMWGAPYSDSWNQKIGAHAGVDIATARGTPLYSIGDGEVFLAGRNSAYGNVVKIKYIYQGEIVYAIYAHMDTINIKKGDKVSRGQKIGTVGNSGNTFGQLGGYHIHFEIDKDNHGRPAYSYTNCPDLSKGHYKIIQNGLCRNELFKYQYDPIRILEAGSTYKYDKEKIENIEDDNKENNNQDNINNEDTNIEDKDSFDKKENLEDDKLDDQEVEKRQEIIDNNSHNSASENIEDDSINDGELEDSKIIDIPDNTNNNTKEDTSIGQNNDQDDSSNEDGPIDYSDFIVEDEKPISDFIDDKNNKNLEEEITKNKEKGEEDLRLIELDLEDVSMLLGHFLDMRTIEMRSDLKENSNLMLGETLTLDIDIFKTGHKSEKENYGFKGVLDESIAFIPSNNKIDIDINNIQLITKGKAEIEITGKETGDTNLIIEIGGNKVGVLKINVK